MRFSAPVKKHWLGSFSVLPPSGLRGFVPVVAGSRGGPEARGPRAGRGGRGDTMPGGGWRPGTRDHICMYVYVYVYTHTYIVQVSELTMYPDLIPTECSLVPILTKPITVAIPKQSTT